MTRFGLVEYMIMAIVPVATLLITLGINPLGFGTLKLIAFGSAASIVALAGFVLMMSFSTSDGEDRIK